MIFGSHMLFSGRPKISVGRTDVSRMPFLTKKYVLHHFAVEIAQIWGLLTDAESSQLSRTFEKTEHFLPQPELQLIMQRRIMTFPKAVAFKVCNFPYFFIRRIFWPISFSKSNILRFWWKRMHLLILFRFLGTSLDTKTLWQAHGITMP